MAPTTVIHRFVELALDDATKHNLAVDCAGDTLTYAQLLALASKLSHDSDVIPSPQQKKNINITERKQRPVVAIISENHPYTLCLILAVWLAGGVAASLDVHAPEVLLRGMLQAVKPHVVVFPERNEVLNKVFKGTCDSQPSLLSRC